MYLSLRINERSAKEKYQPTNRQYKGCYELQFNFHGNDLLLKRIDVLLRYGVGEEGGVLRLGVESRFQFCPLCSIGKCRFRCLDSCFEGFLGLYVLGVGCFGGIKQVHAQLLFPARTSLEIEGLRFVEFAPYASKHSM